MVNRVAAGMQEYNVQKLRFHTLGRFIEQEACDWTSSTNSEFGTFRVHVCCHILERSAAVLL